jgi:hypothetical protein
MNILLIINGYLYDSGTISLGYMYDTGGKVHLKNDKDAVIRINDSKVETGWTGLRITAGLRFDFN